MIILIGLILAFIFGAAAGWVFFNLTTGARLDAHLRKYEQSDPVLRSEIKSQEEHIANLRLATSDVQYRQVLESMGWRPLTSETHPKDGEQILVTGVKTDVLGRAPNGSHYAQFKKLENGRAKLSQGSAGPRPVKMDGTILWIPQRFLLK